MVKAFSHSGESVQVSGMRNHTAATAVRKSSNPSIINTVTLEREHIVVCVCVCVGKPLVHQYILTGVKGCSSVWAAFR